MSAPKVPRCRGANYHVFALGASKCSICGYDRYPATVAAPVVSAPEPTANRLCRCPKCHSKAVMVREIAEMSHPLNQTVGGNWRRELSTEDPHVFAHYGCCRSCRHTWKFRRDPTIDGRRWAADDGEHEDPTIEVPNV